MFSVFRNINKFAGKSKLLDGFEIFCARWLIYLMVVFLFVCAFNFHSKGLFVYPLLSGLCAAFVFDKAIYIFFKEKRPATLKSTTVLIPVPQNPSFPSRHASLIFGISFYIFFYSTAWAFPLALVFLACSCLIGIARVFCGVHWPRDILAGAFVGFISALIVYFLVNLIR
jgi:undecaprenyl-diphosphatase